MLDAEVLADVDLHVPATNHGSDRSQLDGFPEQKWELERTHPLNEYHIFQAGTKRRITLRAAVLLRGGGSPSPSSFGCCVWHTKIQGPLVSWIPA